MPRRRFLTFVACVAFAVGALAIVSPATLLTGKGANAGAVAVTMMREVGVLIVASGLLAALVRSHPASTTLRAILGANAFLQLAIFPIEIVAHVEGTFPVLAGILPNSVFHLIAAGGFVYFASACRTEPVEPGDVARAPRISER